MWKSDRRLYVTADRKRVVAETDPEAAFLLIHEGGELPEAEARRLGLIPSEEAKVDEKPADKAAAKPADKARKPSANK